MTLILVTLGAIVAYILACAWWPMTSCGKCSGMGRFRSPTGKSWRPCRRCKGSGAKIRIGRRIWNALH